MRLNQKGMMMTMNEVPVWPVEYKVLVKAREIEERTEGGIILPETERIKQQHAIEVGTLVAIGGMAFTEPDWPNPPKVGDSVIFNRYAGSEINYKGTIYKLMNDKDLNAIVTQDFVDGFK